MKYLYEQFAVGVDGSAVESCRGLAAGARGHGGPSGPGQPAVCERRALGVTFGDALGRPAERYGPYKSVHKRFVRWARAGVWDAVFADLVKDRKNPNLMIDSTIVRAPQQAAAGRADRKKGARKTRLWGEAEAD